MLSKAPAYELLEEGIFEDWHSVVLSFIQVHTDEQRETLGLQIFSLGSDFWPSAFTIWSKKKSRFHLMTSAAIYSWASQREIFHFLLNTAVTGACRFSPSCQPQGVQHVRPVSLSVERQETGRAKEKQKPVGKVKHYSPPQ